MKQIDLNEYKHAISPIKLQITFNYEEPKIMDFVPSRNFKPNNNDININNSNIVITMDFIEKHCRSIKDRCSNIIKNSNNKIKAIIFNVDSNVIYIEQLFAGLDLFDDVGFYFMFFDAVKTIDVINRGNEQIYVVIPNEMDKPSYKKIKRKIISSKFVRYINIVTRYTTLTRLNLKHFHTYITINDDGIYLKGLSEGLKSLYEIAFIPNNVIVNSPSNKHITELFHLSIVKGPIYKEGCCHIIHKLFKNRKDRLQNIHKKIENIKDLHDYCFVLPYRNKDHRLFVLMFYFMGIIITSSCEYNSTINNNNHITFSFSVSPRHDGNNYTDIHDLKRMGNCVWYNETSLNIFGVNDVMKKYGLIKDDNIKYHIFNNLTLHICEEDIPIKELTDVNNNIKLQNILGDALAYRLLHQNSNNLKDLAMDTIAIRIWQWFVYLISADNSFTYDHYCDSSLVMRILPKYDKKRITFYDFPSEIYLEDIRKQKNYEGYNKLLHDEKLQHIISLINGCPGHCFGVYRIANSNKFQYAIADINYTQSKFDPDYFDEDLNISIDFFSKLYYYKIDVLLPSTPRNMEYELVYYDNNDKRKKVILNEDNYEEVFKFPTLNSEFKISMGNIIPFNKMKKYNIPKYICNYFYYPYGVYFYNRIIVSIYNDTIKQTLDDNNEQLTYEDLFEDLPENKIMGGNNMNSMYMFMILALSIIVVIVIIIVIVVKRKCPKGCVDGNNL